MHFFVFSPIQNHSQIRIVESGTIFVVYNIVKKGSSLEEQHSLYQTQMHIQEQSKIVTSNQRIARVV